MAPHNDGPNDSAHPAATEFELRQGITGFYMAPKGAESVPDPEQPSEIRPTIDPDWAGQFILD